MGEQSSLVTRARRKLGRAKRRAGNWLLAQRLKRWQAANQVSTTRFQDRLQRSASAAPADLLERLQADHATYITTVSIKRQAASWQFVALLARLLSTGAFSSAVDFGSGFTSYTIRQWSQSAGVSLQTASVDDSPAWLDRTRAYLTQQGVPADHLYVEPDFLATGSPQRPDLLVYDYSQFEHRTHFLPQIGRFLRPDSIILFDDYQFRPDTAEYHRTLDYWCFEHSIKIVDLKSQTIDDYGRYAVLGYNARSAFEALLQRL